MATRKIDREILCLKDKDSHGYQSMGILHHIGLQKAFQGLFKYISMVEAIQLLKETGDPDYKQLISILSGFEYDFEFDDDDDLNQVREDIYEVHVEGKKIGYYTTRYERSPKNRKAAIEIHGKKCMACGFDFEKVYGPLGKNFIEVHHTKPLSSVDEEVVVDSEKDLVVLCSNCHSMIHRKKDHVLTLEELKKTLNPIGKSDNLYKK